MWVNRPHSECSCPTSQILCSVSCLGTNTICGSGRPTCWFRETLLIFTSPVHLCNGKDIYFFETVNTGCGRGRNPLFLVLLGRINCNTSKHLRNYFKICLFFKYGTLPEFEHHTCAGVMLISSVSFQIQHMCCLSKWLKLVWTEGWGCSSVAEHLASTHRPQPDSILSNRGWWGRRIFKKTCWSRSSPATWRVWGQPGLESLSQWEKKGRGKGSHKY